MRCVNQCRYVDIAYNESIRPRPRLRRLVLTLSCACHQLEAGGHKQGWTYTFFLSSSISLYVLHEKKKKAPMMRIPPAIAATDRGSPVRK